MLSSFNLKDFDNRSWI